jgi:glycosyltransferase involved in cell wall biosynthesis
MVSEHASPLAALGGVDAGGQNVHVAALSEHIARCGARVVVHTRREDAAIPRQVRFAPGVVVDHVDAGPPEPVPKDELLPHMDDFANELFRSWRRDQPDLVHAHFWMSGLAALRAARALGVPVVQTFHALGVVKRRHQGDRDTSPRPRAAIEEMISRKADRIIATCSDEVFELRRLGADASHISVVPCGVDLSLFRPDGPVAPRSPGRMRLLYVGRLVERKGIADIVSALAALPDVELLIAGGPDRRGIAADLEARRLTTIAAAAGTADRVHLLGRVARTDLPALMRSADAVISVPWYEPFGIVPLEAMACGVTVVASAVGGLVDSVVDGVTGVQVPARSPTALASALGHLLADADRRARLGRAGAARARRRYGWARVASSTLDVYRPLTRAASGRPSVAQ